MPDGSTVDTSIYKNQQQQQSPLENLAQVADSMKSMNSMKSMMNRTKSPGSYSETGSDTMSRLGAGTAYGE